MCTYPTLLAVSDTIVKSWRKNLQIRTGTCIRGKSGKKSSHLEIFIIIKTLFNNNPRWPAAIKRDKNDQRKIQPSLHNWLQTRAISAPYSFLLNALSRCTALLLDLAASVRGSSSSNRVFFELQISFQISIIIKRPVGLSEMPSHCFHKPIARFKPLRTHWIIIGMITIAKSLGHIQLSLCAIWCSLKFSDRWRQLCWRFQIIGFNFNVASTKMCSEVPNQPIKWCVEGDFIGEYTLKQGEHLELAAFRVFTTWIRIVVSRKVLSQIIGMCLVVKGIAECSPCQNIERGLAIVTNVVNLFRILDNGDRHEANCHVPCANEKSRSQSKDKVGMLTVRLARCGPLLPHPISNRGPSKLHALDHWGSVCSLR